MVSSPRSWLRHKGWFTSLSLALLLLLPAGAKARSMADDPTPPMVAYTIDGVSGTNNWYRGSSGGNFVVVHWTVSDPDSPISSTVGCEPAIKIDGPNSGTTRTCSATSDGGTTAVTTKSIKIDATAPTGVAAAAGRGPDVNGWYNQPVGITWSGSDATSGISSCSSTTYSGPDSTAASPTGTCTDNAGNTSGSVALPLKYDNTDPTVNAPAASRGPDQAGWYNHAVGITWTGADATSGIASCTSLTYSAPDSASAAPSGSCIDQAGNTSTSRTFSLSYDDTAPSASPSAGRQPDSNGWYNGPVAISWSGSDATSGIASCSPQLTYSGPDSASASASGGCIDRAGNSTTTPFALKFDDTAPVSVTATPSRSSDRNGWYNHSVGITWNGADPTSGIASCSSLSYSSPDTAGASPTGSCTDRAGNSTTVAFGLKYDATAPVSVTASPARSPDSNGWYNHPVAIGWGGSDPTSGIASCTSLTYSAPDNGAASPSGTCTDNAGNSSSAVGFGLKYDATGPSVSVSTARQPDHNGWYNHPVSITWNGTDATSGIASCSGSVDYSGPDRDAVTPFGGCTDKAGNAATPSLTFKYDSTAPVTSVAAGRAPDANGWYNHPVAIGWGGSDPTSGIASCSALTYGGPDTGASTQAGSCSDNAGNTSAQVPFTLSYDATPPLVTTAGAARRPDHDGWYNRPLTVTWSGSDTTAGLASCTSLTYSGPDNPAASLGGGCIDRAGNASAPLPFALRYDQSPPRLRDMSLRAADGMVVLAWEVSGATGVKIERTPGVRRSAASALYNGKGSTYRDRSVSNFVKYRYTLEASDAAGNEVTRTMMATPKPALFAPVPGARVAAGRALLFRWSPVPNARYYNLQLWLGSRRMGSWWPSHAWLRLPARWRFEGKQQRLVDGEYQWYLWPGRGPRSLGRYGPMLGKSTFVAN